MKNRNDFRQAEALGHIKTMPEVEQQQELTEEVKPAVIDSPDDFRMAVAEAQMAGVDHLVVSERVMKYLLRGNKSEYLTYGDPGLKIFLEGTKEEIERRERMSAEQYHEYYMKKMNGNA